MTTISANLAHQDFALSWDSAWVQEDGSNCGSDPNTK
ncbi:UNVERIFIED_ORG: hypothetical protein J2W38_005921 [Variovorax paradoxus]|nr:hypothetical protein [Variovorax paradoxus]